MSRSVRDYLKHIRDVTLYLQSSVEGVSKTEFLSDETLKRAFVRSIEVVGEATKQIPSELLSEYPQIEWRSIARMRDHLILSYFGIDYDIVWDVLINHVPKLSQVVDEMLRRKDIH